MINAKTGERELCYLTRIDAVTPIPGYDRVELAHVGGWTIVVGKGEFKAGDPAIYFEIDSQLPEKPPFSDMEFLASKHYKIKTQKMCKSISQGLLMSVAQFGWEIQADGSVWDLGSGDHGRHDLNDESRFLTKELEVTYAIPEDNKRKANSMDKYKKMAQRHPKLFRNRVIKWLMNRGWGRTLLFFFFGKKKDKLTSFPTHFPFVKRSDEERCENIPNILQNKEPFIKTLKVDGTSSTYILERKFFKNEFYVCSRNVRQLTPNQKTFHSDNVYWSVAFKYHIRDFLEQMLKEHSDWKYVALQGETAGIGEDGGKIQGDPHQLKELRFFGFNFIDSKNGRWNSVKAKELTSKYGIEWVPIIDENYILPDDFEDFKKSADGPCDIPNSKGLREGWVYRAQNNPNFSFKNVSREYLLKH